MSDQTNGVIEAQLLVDAIQVRTAKSAKFHWRLADLTAEHVHGQGRPSKTSGSTMFSLKEWDEKIGWTERGFQYSTLRDMMAEARAWPSELRVKEHGFWRHYEARAMFKGDVQKAHDWLVGRTGNITEQAREGILGHSALSEAVLHLIKARRRILLVPPLLAKEGFRGDENEMRQLTREVERLADALTYIRRFLADEAEVSGEELEEAINRILSEEAS